jgi:hypothetical protein
MSAPVVAAARRPTATGMIVAAVCMMICIVSFIVGGYLAGH